MNKIWTKAIKAAADPERSARFYKLLSEAMPEKAGLEGASEEQARILAGLFSGSEVLSTALVTRPDWLAGLAPELIRFPRRKQGLQQTLKKLLADPENQGSPQRLLSMIRTFKQQELLRIGARDLAGLATVPEITRELSDLADVALDAVWQTCYSQLAEKVGRPWHQTPSGEWQPATACVLGLGKLGGQELNYSSDVDVVFVYSEEGQVFKGGPPNRPQGGRAAAASSTPRAGLTNHQFFNRLAEIFTGEVGKLAPEGTLYRMDLRLRPEGDAGPLSRSLASYEIYYSQWGQTWERMMLIKARAVGGDRALEAEFLEMIQPFRYPRSIQPGALREIGAMKDRIENEVVRSGELNTNVKLGRGGIREIEFIAQSLQLLHAGRQPFLQGSQTLPTLEKLIQYELLSVEASRWLTEAYCFLRAVEHRLQMEANLQTHTIPPGQLARTRLARLMGYKDSEAFEEARRTMTSRVRSVFDRVLKSERVEPSGPRSLPNEFEGVESEWIELLSRHRFREPTTALRVLREFVEGPGYVHVSSRTKELALALIPRVFELCREARSAEGPQAATQDSAKAAPLSDPDRVLTRLDTFISAYGARATLFELWNRNPAIFDLLLLLFDRSEFLAELAIRTPDLVDELVASGRLRQRKSAEDTLRDLRHGLADAEQHAWLRRYHQAELMRIGLRDILGLADFEQYLVELSALADACLRYSLEVVLRRNRLKAPPFAIIGLGKLGGSEIDYGSDLDIVFVAPNKAKDLARLSRLAVELKELVSARTDLGTVFQLDARLRPDGEKGLLVNTIGAYEEYYRQRAMLWEIQTLTRTRAVAGDVKTGTAFEELAEKLTNFRQPSLPLAAYAPDWKQRIHQMRLRIERERTPEGKQDLAIKTGAGGLIDAEFLAQALCLEHGWREANTLSALERGEADAVLPLASALIDNYRHLRRIEGILRRWSYEGETVLPDTPEPFQRVGIRCGFKTSNEFSVFLAGCRKVIREAYLAFFRF